jgi:trans-L-3-hydroxyproline dehydratase
MCGHATIAIGRWAVDSGRVALRDGRARFALEAPCGLVRVEVDATGDDAPLVTFESVESFAGQRDRRIEVPGYGVVRVDIAFGGAYYAILPASRLGLSLRDTPLETLAAAGVAITAAARRTLTIVHPGEPDLGFLYGTILTDDVALGDHGGRPSYNLCIFAAGQIDRSPTGSGVTARIALAAARGDMAVGHVCEIRGASGEGFSGTLTQSEKRDGAMIARVRVAGRSYYAARTEFIAEPGDRLADGFELPEKLAGLPTSMRGRT